MKREALKLALEALENHTAIKHPQQIHYRDKAITAIKEALAQPEPCDMGDICIGCSPRNADGSCPSSQRTWVGLTDEEMESTFLECGGQWNGDFWKIEDADFHPFVRTIEALVHEAKLKQKNGYAEEKNT